MLKKLKLKNSVVLFIGILIVFIGIFIGTFEYLESKKNKAFSKMNIMLYEREIPKNIEEKIDDSNSLPSQENNDPIVEEPTGDGDDNGSWSGPYVVYNYIGILEIPKLNLRRGFYSLDSPYNNVDSNITVINGSSFPDEENNNLILAAHSGNCSYCYFNTLYKLEIGDIAYLTYAGETHTYKIVNIYIVEKTGTVTIYRNYNTKVMTFITCTRNSNTEQTVYILEIQD